MNTYPRRKPIRLPADAYYKPATWYYVTVCCRAKESLFESPAKRDLVQQILRQTAMQNRVELAAYTIMPNHLHAICSAGEQGLPGFIRGFKSKTAVEFRRRFNQSSPWQFRYFDHKVRSEESLQEKSRYVWLNPVRWGLVRRPEDYPWNGSLRSD
jgi:REP element-mobilizing transposase RayT